MAEASFSYFLALPRQLRFMVMGPRNRSEMAPFRRIKYVRLLTKLTNDRRLLEYASSHLRWMGDAPDEKVETFLCEFRQYLKRIESKVTIPIEKGWPLQRAQEIATLDDQFHRRGITLYQLSRDENGRWDQAWGGVNLIGCAEYVHSMEIHSDPIGFRIWEDGRFPGKAKILNFQAQAGQLLSQATSGSFSDEATSMFCELLEKGEEALQADGHSVPRRCSFATLSGHHVEFFASIGGYWTDRDFGHIAMTIQAPNWDPFLRAFTEPNVARETDLNIEKTILDNY